MILIFLILNQISGKLFRFAQGNGYLGVQGEELTLKSKQESESFMIKSYGNYEDESYFIVNSDGTMAAKVIEAGDNRIFGFAPLDTSDENQKFTIVMQPNGKFKITIRKRTNCVELDRKNRYFVIKECRANNTDQEFKVKPHDDEEKYNPLAIPIEKERLNQLYKEIRECKSKHTE